MPRTRKAKPAAKPLVMDAQRHAYLLTRRADPTVELLLLAEAMDLPDTPLPADTRHVLADLKFRAAREGVKPSTLLWSTHPGRFT